jgi:hypothetical protein
VVRFLGVARIPKPRAVQHRRSRPAFDPRRHDRSDDGNAFIPDPGEGPARAPDDLAESMAEEFVEAATTGEDRDEELLDATFPEEIGGPFVETAAAEELIDDVDDGNPPDATREPLPLPVAGLTTSPPDEISDEVAEAEESEPDAARAEPPGSPNPVEPAPGSAALNRGIPSRRSSD